jgi:DNA invertase Pin-like site-specific DNA recombinase
MGFAAAKLGLMEVFAYSYSDLWVDSPLAAAIWDPKVERIYQDLGGRQQLEQLLQDLRTASETESEIYLLIRELKELGDSMQDVSNRLAQLESLNVHLIVTEEDIGTGEGSLKRSELLSLLRTVEHNQHRHRLRRGHAQNRLKALPPPGKAPYGYRRGKDRYILDRSSAPVVKDFFDHFLLYGSLRGSVRYLQKKYNKKISVSTGQRWLTSPVYRGDLSYQTGEVVPDTHVPILSRDEAAQIDRLLRRNRRMPSRTASAPRSLSGLVFCGTCQSPMTFCRVTAKPAQEYLYLRPSHCPQQPRCRAIAYPQVLEQTIQQICRTLPDAVSTAAIPDTDAIKQQIMAKITAKQAILAELPDWISRDVLDPETAQLRAYNIRTEIAALQAKAAQLPPVNLKATAQIVSIPQFWLDLSEAERRFYFREFIRQIQIHRQGKEWHLEVVFIF